MIMVYMYTIYNITKEVFENAPDAMAPHLDETKA